MTQEAGGAAATGGSSGGTTATATSSSGSATGSTSSAGGTGTSAGTGSTGGGSAAGSGGSSGGGTASNQGGGGQTSQQGGGSEVGSGQGSTSSASAGEAWGANWRESYAGSDDKKLNVLKRYNSPRELMDALFHARQRIDSGELRAQLPKDATAEQLATYRKDNGIPEKADGYFEKLPDGVTLDDEDRARLAPYAELMHRHNISPEVAAEFLGVRAKSIDALIDQQNENDRNMRLQTEDALRREWGNDYRANVNNIHGMLQGAPEEVREAIMSARAPDGSALFNDPKVMQYFAQLARELSPYHTIVGGDGGAMDQKGVEARLAEITRWMGAPAGSEDYKRYYSNEKVQAEYRELVDARDRLRKRVA